MACLGGLQILGFYPGFFKSPPSGKTPLVECVCGGLPLVFYVNFFCLEYLIMLQFTETAKRGERQTQRDWEI